MNRQFEETLIEALDLLEQGTPVVTILSRYPDMANELRPYLSTAIELDRLALPASTAAEEASRKEFLQYASTLRDNPGRPTGAWLRRVLASGLVLVLLIAACGTMIATLATGALPGDTLYGSKLFLEKARLDYSADPDNATTLLENFRQERVDEVNSLLALGRAEKVVFIGTAEQVTVDRWIVEGIPVAITPLTTIQDDVEIGFVVQVTGTTSADGVLADNIEVYGGRQTGPDQVEPAPAVEPSPAPAPTREASPTPEPTRTLLPGDTSPTTTVPPSPTSQPVPEDDLSEQESVDQGSGEDGAAEDGGQVESDSGDGGSGGEHDDQSSVDDAESLGDNESAPQQEDKSEDSSDDGQQDGGSGGEDQSHGEDSES
ncbi:MAG: DUF5667 domain-containing protein [Candidatus Promineifilaceae bacterium]